LIEFVENRRMVLDGFAEAQRLKLIDFARDEGVVGLAFVPEVGTRLSVSRQRAGRRGEKGRSAACCPRVGPNEVSNEPQRSTCFGHEDVTRTDILQ